MTDDFMAAKVVLPVDQELVSELRACFQQGPILLYQGQELRSLNEQLVASVNGLKISIYAKEHPPPHFHVDYNGEANSFNITDGEPLYPNGGLKSYFRNVKKWWSKNKSTLVSTWNDTRPANCPVGPILDT